MQYRAVYSCGSVWDGTRTEQSWTPFGGPMGSPFSSALSFRGGGSLALLPNPSLQWPRLRAKSRAVSLFAVGVMATPAGHAARQNRRLLINDKSVTEDLRWV